MIPTLWPLAELTEADSAALNRLAEASVIPADVPFIQRGEHPHALFLLQEGTASVRAERHGRVAEVTRVSDGALLGEMSLVSGDPASATVVALDQGVVSQADLAILTPEEILARMEASPAEELLLAECREHRDRLVAVAARCRSLDLARYALGVETFFGMNLAARGYI